jgi:hypothetical protein
MPIPTRGGMGAVWAFGCEGWACCGSMGVSIEVEGKDGDRSREGPPRFDGPGGSL